MHTIVEKSARTSRRSPHRCNCWQAWTRLDLLAGASPTMAACGDVFSRSLLIWGLRLCDIGKDHVDWAGVANLPLPLPPFHQQCRHAERVSEDPGRCLLLRSLTNCRRSNSAELWFVPRAPARFGNMSKHDLSRVITNNESHAS